MRMRRCLAFAAWLMLAADPVAAQAELERGTRVRVTPVEGGRFSGTVQSLSPDSLVVVRRDLELRFSRANLRKIEVSAGRSRWPWRGMAVGLVAGAAIGAIVGASVDSTHSLENCDRGCSIGLGVTALGGAGALAGGAIGAAIARERWRDVTEHGRGAGVRLRVNSYGLGVAISF